MRSPRGRSRPTRCPGHCRDGRGALLNERLRLGGDFRTATTRTAIPGQPSSRVGGTEQARLYADVQLVKD
ncbi:hypothetical protein [Roseateles saccharophilus]|uniref:Uncharacterized protein n=1 Tax=Roseateles saccharophilus TaxID=304 RepID=A0A4R3VI79_ROSSA|nr:hypothetical protein [Roseateles saccharophilus]MDG0832160.1 hypothetical protein [Roseateles saccharophilus]TCV03572.1 hypothetical protein EV671_1003230 [Roseateles saccharophilus]